MTAGASLVAAATVALLASFPVTCLLGLLATLLLVAAAVPRELGALTRLLTAGAFLYTAITVAAFLPVPLQVSGTAVLAIASAVATGVVRSSGRSWQPTVRRSDVAAATSGMVVLAALLLPASSRTSAGHLSFLWLGYDHGAHLSILNGIVRAGGYLHGDNGVVEPTVLPYLQGYPQGLHLNVGFVRTLLGQSDAGSAVDLYVFALLAAFALMATCITLAAVRIAEQLGATPLALVATTVVTTSAVLAGPFALLVIPGFFTQIAAYALLALLLLACVHTEFRIRPWLQLVTAACLVSAISSTWYFLLPVAAAATLVVVWLHRRLLLARRVPAAALVAGCALATVPHVFVSLGEGAADWINASGGVVPLRRSTVVVLVAIALAAPVLRRSAREFLVPHAWCTAMAVLFAVALRQYQVSTLGSTSYYYEKSLYTILVLGLPGVGAVAAVLLTVPGPGRRLDRPALRSAVALLLVLVTGAVYVDQHARRPATLYSINKSVPDLSAPFAAALTGARPDGQVLLWHYGTAYEDFWGNRLIGGALGQASDLRYAVLVAVENEQRALRLRPLLTPGSSLTLITDDSGLKEELAREGLTADELGRVTVTVVASSAPECRRRQEC